MINAGRFLINTFGPALLAGFVFLGLWQIPPLHWRWLFWLPPMFTSCVAISMALIVKSTPPAAGFAHAGIGAQSEVRASVREVFVTIARNPVVWIIALAYACTGSVRQGIDQWFFRFMQEVHHLEL